MKALIYKDLMAQKKAMALLVAVITFMGTYMYSQGKPFLLPLVFVLIPIIMLSILFGTDMQSKADLYIIPSPLKRRTIVLSRYAIVWGFACIGALISILIILFSKNNDFPIPWYLVASFSLLLNTLGAIVQLPLMYKFGIEKAKLIFMLIYFSFFATMAYIGENKELITGLIHKIAGLHVPVISLIVLTITIVFNLTSFLISATIYERMEF